MSSATTVGAGGVDQPPKADPRDTDGPPSSPSFASGARVLSIGIASTGIFTFAYLATASHVLSRRDYGLISLCWSVMFVILSVIYRPIEQLLSRMIADRRARGLHGHPLRVPASIQFGFALVFVVVALALRHEIQQGMFDGSGALYWILVIGVIAYAGSYFARGWLAGHQYFALYGALVFLESTSRYVFPFAVAIGIGSGIGTVGLGIAVAPFASLAVMPFAFSRIRRSIPRAPAGVPVADAAAEGPAHAGLEEASADLSLRHGAGFAASVVGIMLSEQALMNAGVLIVAANSGAADLTVGLTGFVFNVMLIVRAPLQLFQAIQTSILPHLAGLEVRESADEFRRAIRTTVLVIAGFGLAVALGLLVIGPPVMNLLLGDKGFHYGRLGLALVGLGMGLHLVSGTLNQAALARGRAPTAAAAWLLSAALFVIFVAAPTIHSEVTRVEVGYFGATAVLSALLWALYRRGPAPTAQRG
ncbi:MAG: lipopolysaccharide biosynthesis protein [Solirubrobacteraceae bacterium]